MAEKTVKTRIQMKRGTSADWALATNFVPWEGEIIFYSDLNKIKVGDGSTLVSNLPFLHVDKSEIENWTHNHNDSYYTESEIDSKLANKADNVVATQEAAGLMSAEDKKFLETIVIPSYGSGCTASGEYSHAEGISTTAEGEGSHAEGTNTTAEGESSHAEGGGTTASGLSSHAEGEGTTASGYYSHAEGHANTAEGEGSHAEGQLTTASGNYSHAEGNSSHAQGHYSHAEGEVTIASGWASHAGGLWTIAGYDNQTVIGEYNDNKENTLFEVGNGTCNSNGPANRSNAFEVLKDGRVKVYGTPTEDEDVVRKGDLATLSSSYTAGEGISISEDGVISISFLHAEDQTF